MNGRKLLRYCLVLAACCALVCAISSQAWRLGIGERQIRVDVRVDASGKLILSGTWCDTGEVVEIRSVSVASVADSKMSCGLAFCGADCKGGERAQPLKGTWKYGDTPVGYVLDGECPNIDVGSVYRVRIGGRIGGDLTFRVGASHEVEVLSPSCDWPNRW